MIEFTVHGEPATQGSKISHAIYNKQGKPVMKNGRVVVVCRESAKGHAAWRNLVAETAIYAMKDKELLTGPVSLCITFIRPRSKSHYGSGKNSQKLKPSAPVYPIVKPDTIKLTRAVEDALKNIVWNDDSQVVDHHLYKRFGEHYETLVVVKEKI